MAVPDRVRSTMRRLGLRGVNKPKRTPRHKTKSHVVMAKSGKQKPSADHLKRVMLRI